MSENNETQQVDWNKYMQEQKNKHLALVNLNKELFKAFCEKHNIARAECYFDGNGDSGQIESYTYFKDDGTEITIPETELVKVIEETHRDVDGKYVREFEEVERTCDYLVDSIAYNILEANHPGWEINEGSFGNVIINKDGTGKLEYNERITTEEYSENLF